MVSQTQEEQAKTLAEQQEHAMRLHELQQLQQHNSQLVSAIQQQQQQQQQQHAHTMPPTPSSTEQQEYTQRLLQLQQLNHQTLAMEEQVAFLLHQQQQQQQQHSGHPMETALPPGGPRELHHGSMMRSHSALHDHTVAMWEEEQKRLRQLEEERVQYEGASQMAQKIRAMQEHSRQQHPNIPSDSVIEELQQKREGGPATQPKGADKAPSSAAPGQNRDDQQDIDLEQVPEQGDASGQLEKSIMPGGSVELAERPVMPRGDVVGPPSRPWDAAAGSLGGHLTTGGIGILPMHPPPMRAQSYAALKLQQGSYDGGVLQGGYQGVLRGTAHPPPGAVPCAVRGSPYGLRSEYGVDVAHTGLRQVELALDELMQSRGQVSTMGIQG